MNYSILKDDYRMVFTIPIGKPDTEKAKKALSEIIASYKYHLNIDFTTRKEKIEKILKKINK